jgi:hypothetical protein
MPEPISSQWTLARHKKYWRELAASLPNTDLVYYWKVMRQAVSELEVQLALRGDLTEALIEVQKRLDEEKKVQ